MIVHTCQQRTPEWMALRLGKLTGSCAKDALATIKAGEAASRRDLRTRLVLERIKGASQESDYINAEMQRGIDLEPAALAAYESRTGQIAQSVGFLEHDTLLAGCSPDGCVESLRGLVSLKCPKSATHLKYLRDADMPAEYVPQMLHELWISGAEFYDFLSFDDRFPAELQTFYVRVPRDQKAIDAYAEKALAFLREVDAELQAVRELMAERHEVLCA